MRRSILSSLRAHLGRLVAACLAIVLGVGFGTLAMTVHASATNGIDQTIGKQNAGVDAVANPNRDSLTAAEAAKVAKLPQAASVVTDISAYLQVQWAGQVRPDSLGVDARYDTSRIAGPTTSSGKLPEAKNEIALPAKLAEKYKVAIGQELKLNTWEGKTYPVKVVGLLDDSTSVGGANAMATARDREGLRARRTTSTSSRSRPLPA